VNKLFLQVGTTYIKNIRNKFTLNVCTQLVYTNMDSV